MTFYDSGDRVSLGIQARQWILCNWDDNSGTICEFLMSNVSWITRPHEEPFVFVAFFTRAGGYHRTNKASWGWLISWEDGLVLCCLLMKRCWLQLYTRLGEQSEGAHSHIFTSSHACQPICFLEPRNALWLHVYISFFIYGREAFCEQQQGRNFLECYMFWNGFIYHIVMTLPNQDLQSPLSWCRGNETESRMMSLLTIASRFTNVLL